MILVAECNQHIAKKMYLLIDTMTDTVEQTLETIFKFLLSNMFEKYFCQVFKHMSDFELWG